VTKFSLEGRARAGDVPVTADKGVRIVSQAEELSICALHQLWARLENQQHELDITIQQAGVDAAAVESMRDRQAFLLLEISAVVAEIREAPATTLEDYLALLDVAIEHEVDLAGDIAFYGPRDFPMITRLLRALAQSVPGFEFNSLRRWLSSPGQYEEVVGDAHAGATEPIGFGER
jgi:hypothetical protein